MTKFLTLIAEGGVFKKKQLLETSSITAMFTPEVIKAYGLILNSLPLVSPFGKRIAFSPGWYSHEYAGRYIYEHQGAGLASTVAAVIPEDRFGIFIATNTLDSRYTSSLEMICAIKFVTIEYFLSLPPTDWIAVFDNK